MLSIQKYREIKPCRLLVVFIGVACLVLIRPAIAETCEGDKLALPDVATFPSVQSSAVAGDVHAQAQMGMAYLRGYGVKHDVATALSWLEKSAAGGSSEGQYLLGSYYFYNGKTESDFRKAASWLQQSADHGCVQALLGLGLLTMHGDGVPKNTEDGFRMISKAARAGYPPAQMSMGLILITGDGAKKDMKAGFNWVKRAADADDSVAEIALAHLYLEGKGTQPNPEEARRLLEKIYEKKDAQSPNAAYMLGWMYMEGKGVPVDTVKAFSWMVYAAQAHVSDSEKRLQTLIGQLPKQKLSTACSVYMDPSLATNGAKEYAHANAGETIAVLSSQATSAVVYFPDRRVLGYVPRQCLSSN
jgi:TPR repeat protein